MTRFKPSLIILNKINYVKTAKITLFVQNAQKNPKFLKSYKFVTF